MKIIGELYSILSKILDGLLSFIINFLNFVLNIITNIRNAFMIFGVFIIIGLFNPLIAFFVLTRRITWVLFFIFVLIPLFGKNTVKGLDYLRYMVTEYLFDKSELHLYGEKMRHNSLKSYGTEYLKKIEEERQRKYREYQKAQQEYWENLFNEFYKNQRAYSNGSQKNQTYYDPTNDFIKKYENSCKILGIEPTADKGLIQRAYRNMAKKYHPDINKGPDATEQFQKINEANAFLGEENINRYKNIVNSN